MKTTLDFLDDCKTALGIESDYALAKALGVAQSSVSNYRIGRSRIDDEVALTIANILQIEPIVVIAHANAERAKTEDQKARWLTLVEKFSVSFRNRLSRVDMHDRRAFSRLMMQ
jgi:transcriptional regulator with XRE-family HTH domain